MTYTRQKIWTDGEVLTAKDLNAEFDAVESGAGGETGGGGGTVSAGGIVAVNAADAEFAPTGAESTAQRVANAISAVALANFPVAGVFIPASFLGYAQTAGYSISIFNTSVMMIREGGPWDAHDPIAYGATPADTDAQIPIQAAFNAAGSGNFTPVVAFTVKGDPDFWLVATAVTPPAGTFLRAISGVRFSGAGASSLDTVRRQSLPVPPFLKSYRQEVAAISVPASGSSSTTVQWGSIPIETLTYFRPLWARVRVRAASGSYGSIWIYGPSGIATATGVVGISAHIAAMFQGVASWDMTLVMENSTGSPISVDADLELQMIELNNPIPAGLINDG